MDLHTFMKLSLVFREEYNEELRETDITYNQLMVLKEIKDNDVKFAKVLQKNLSSDRATTSQFVAALEKKGYLTRDGDDSDGRKKVLALTKKGYDICEQIIEVEEELQRLVTRELSKKEIEKLDEIVAKAYNGLV
ncbi:MAG: MarR family winged helix-turn-helix transcriptional regulator [Mycoplasmatales bacterium]